MSEEHIVDINNKIINFELKASVSSMTDCWLIIRHPEASANEISQIIPFKIKMNFISKFDF